MARPWRPKILNMLGTASGRRQNFPSNGSQILEISCRKERRGVNIPCFRTATRVATEMCYTVKEEGRVVPEPAWPPCFGHRTFRTRPFHPVRHLAEDQGTKNKAPRPRHGPYPPTEARQRESGPSLVLRESQQKCDSGALDYPSESQPGRDRRSATSFGSQTESRRKGR